MILIVDDDDDFREFCRDVLEGLGHRVVASFDVDRALIEIETQTFDLILSDYVMPGKNGLTFLSTLKERGRPEADKFILMTGLPIEQFPQSMRLLQKPFEVEALRQILLSLPL